MISAALPLTTPGTTQPQLCIYIHFYFSILTGDSGRQVSNRIQETSKEATRLHDLHDVYMI